MPHNTTNLRIVGSPTSAADAPELENTQTQDPSDVDIDDMIVEIPTRIARPKQQESAVAAVHRNLPAHLKNFLKKDRSFRKGVFERKILHDNALVKPGEKYFVLGKTMNRNFNPHKQEIAREARKQSGSVVPYGVAAGAAASISRDDGAVTPPFDFSSSSIVESTPISNPSSAMHSGVPPQPFIQGSSSSQQLTRRSSSSLNNNNAPRRNAGLKRQETLLWIPNPPSEDLAPSGSSKAQQQTTANGRLSRDKTLPSIAPSTKPDAQPHLARVHEAPHLNVSKNKQLTYQKTEPFIQNSPPTPPTSTPSVNAKLANQKTEPFIFPSLPAPASPDSSTAHNAAHATRPSGHGQASGPSRPKPRDIELARQKAAAMSKLPGRISPPRASEPVVTTSNASGHVVPHRQAADPGLTRQHSVHVQPPQENGVQDGQGNDDDRDAGESDEMELPIASDDDGQWGHGNGRNDSSNSDDSDEEHPFGKYDFEDVKLTEHDTFNDFFPEHRLELPQDLLDYIPPADFPDSPPDDFDGNEADYVEALFNTVCEQVDVAKALVQHVRPRANNALAETFLAEKYLNEVYKLIKAFERGMRRDAGDLYYQYYLQMIEEGAGDASDEDEPPIMSPQTLMETLMSDPKNRIVPREEVDSEEDYIVTPPFSGPDGTGRAPRTPGSPQTQARPTQERSPASPDGPSTHLVPATFTSPAMPTDERALAPIIHAPTPRQANAVPTFLPNTNNALGLVHHYQSSKSPEIPEPPIVHGHKRAREDDSDEDSGTEGGDEKVSGPWDMVRRSDRPMVKRMRFRAPSTSGPSSDVEVRENSRNVRGGRRERGRQGASAGSSSSSPRRKTWFEMEMDKIRDAKGKGREQEEQLQADDERMIYERVQEAVRGEASAGSSSPSPRQKTWFEMELEKKMREDQEKDEKLRVEAEEMAAEGAGTFAPRQKTWFEMELEKKMREDQEKEEKLQAEAERMIIESASLPSSRPKTWFEIELAKKIQADNNMGESSKAYIETHGNSPTFSLPTSPTPERAQLPISPLQLDPSQGPKTWFQIELEKKAQADKNDEQYIEGRGSSPTFSLPSSPTPDHVQLPISPLQLEPSRGQKTWLEIELEKKAQADKNERQLHGESSREYIETRGTSPTFPLLNSPTTERVQLPLSPLPPSFPHLPPPPSPSIKHEPLPTLIPPTTNRPPVPDHEIIDVDTYVYVDHPAQPSTSTSQAGLVPPVRTRRRVVRETSGPRPYARKRNGVTSGSSLESLESLDMGFGGDGIGRVGMNTIVGSSRVGGAWERAERRASGRPGSTIARMSGTASGSGSGSASKQMGFRGRS